MALLLVAPSAAAEGRPRQTVLRGQTDQNQPMLLRLVRSERLLSFRIGLLVLDCRGRGSSVASPGVRVVRANRWLHYDRQGRLGTSYSTQQHVRDVSDGSLQYDARIRSRVTFRAVVGDHGSASGSFRVARRVRGRVIGEAGLEPIGYRCVSGTHRWRVPRLNFSGPWRPTGPMLNPRSFGAMVPLQDGRVLLAGGTGIGSGPFLAAETYEPGRNRWTSAGAMLHGRSFAATVRLADGRVLVAGGEAHGSGRATRSAEIYSPGRNRWSAARPMVLRRDRPAATLLDNGLVLVTGGDPDAQLLTAELYDPAADTWTRVPDSPLPGDAGTVAGSAPAGRVMVVASDGFASTGVSSLYDPASNAWTQPEVVPGIGADDSWRFASLSLLHDGRVLLLGDCRGGTRATAIYGPAAWSSGPRGAPCGFSALATTLPSGRVLVPGNRGAALYDPTDNRWTLAPSYFFPSSAEVDREYIAPVPGGALVVGSDLTLNRFTAAERFFER